jgi:hypothetical protein
MDDQEALNIVSALASGANPLSGEMFAADSPYQSPGVIRALFAAQRALAAQLQPSQRPTKAQPAAPSSATSSNAGKPWSTEEDKELLAAFDADRPIAEIACAHARTLGGVRARLEKHGRLEPSAAARWPQNPSGSDRANKSGHSRAEEPRP